MSGDDNDEMRSRKLGLGAVFASGYDCDCIVMVFRVGPRARSTIPRQEV